MLKKENRVRDKSHRVRTVTTTFGCVGFGSHGRRHLLRGGERADATYDRALSTEFPGVIPPGGRDSTRRAIGRMSANRRGPNLCTCRT